MSLSSRKNQLSVPRYSLKITPLCAVTPSLHVLVRVRFSFSFCWLQKFSMCLCPPTPVCICKATFLRFAPVEKLPPKGRPCVGAAMDAVSLVLWTCDVCRQSRTMNIMKQKKRAKKLPMKSVCSVVVCTFVVVVVLFFSLKEKLLCCGALALCVTLLSRVFSFPPLEQHISMPVSSSFA